MKIAHMVRAGIVMLALLIVPSVTTATAHDQSTDRGAVASAPRTVVSGNADTPWGP